EWPTGRFHMTCTSSSRTGENPPYGMIERVVETSASFEARSAPRSYSPAGGDQQWSSLPRPLETTCVHQRNYQWRLNTPRKTGSCRRPLGLVKFAASQFLDLSLKRCTLGGVCRDDLQTISSTIPPSPRGNSRGLF